MEELYMGIIKFFSAYGWQMTVLAVSGIFLLGVLKSVKAFDWIRIYAVVGEEKTLQVDKTKQVKKIVYTFISAGLSVSACCVYLTIINTGLSATLILTISGTVWSLNTIAYMLYENLGVRAVWKAFLAKISAVLLILIQKAKDRAEANKARRDAQTESDNATEKTALETAFNTISAAFGEKPDDIRKAVELLKTLKK
ncbi:hypothetical protein EOM82_07580 [bacterium]|nr:hypothetical protein [bacterium]